MKLVLLHIVVWSVLQGLAITVISSLILVYCMEVLHFLASVFIALTLLRRILSCSVVVIVMFIASIGVIYSCSGV